MWAKVGSIVVCLSAALACAGAEPRVSRQLDNYSGVLVSNWPARGERPEPRRENGGITFSYPFLVDNQGPVPATLHFESAVAIARTKVGRVSCSAAGFRGSTVTLPPKDRTRVDCKVWLGPDVVNVIASGDTSVSLVIPLTPSKEAIALFYLLRVEDAS